MTELDKKIKQGLEDMKTIERLTRPARKAMLERAAARSGKIRYGFDRHAGFKR